MDVLDAADVGALVDIDPDLQRAGKDVADQVQFVPFGAYVNGLVRVGQGQVQDLAQLAIGADGPGIRHHVRQRLLGVMDNQIANYGIGLERDERLALRLASAPERQEHRSDGVFAVRHASGSPASVTPGGTIKGPFKR